MHSVMIRPVITYGSETWTLNKQAANIVNTFERRILRRIYGPIQVNGIWRMRHNEELYQLYKNNDLATTIPVSYTHLDVYKRQLS